MLFDDHVDICCNVSDDNKKHLKLKEIPEDSELFDNKTNKNSTKMKRVRIVFTWRHKQSSD